MSHNDELDGARVAAKAAGLERYFRSRAFNQLNRLFILFLIGGGLVVAVSTHTKGSLSTAVVLCVLVTAVCATVFIARYFSVRARLRRDLAGEIARLARRPGKPERTFFAGSELGGPRPRAGEFNAAFDPDALDPYEALRAVDVLGQKSESSQDGVNRTSDDSERGPIS